VHICEIKIDLALVSNGSPWSRTTITAVVSRTLRCDVRAKEGCAGKSVRYSLKYAVSLVNRLPSLLRNMAIVRKYASASSLSNVGQLIAQCMTG
jgi:hypothetical protein